MRSIRSDTTRRISPRRVAGAMVLGVWAALFWYLLVKDKSSLFLAARVQWLVPVAAVCFTLAAAGRIATLRAANPVPLDLRAGSELAALVAPALLILIVPLGTLSSFAAERRTDFSLAQFSSTDPIEAGSPLTFQQLAGVQADGDAADELAGRAGEELELVGLAMSPTTDGFMLSRFVVSCCVVDATVAEIRVQTPAAVSEGGWVEVTGQLAIDAGGDAFIAGAAVAPSAAPDPPYLYPSS